MSARRFVLTAFGTLAALPLVVAGQQRATEDEQRFVFRTGIDLINVTATVTDRRGRFVGGLTQDDFIIYEDGRQVDVTNFSNERVSVSLGIALDTSGSMDGRRMDAARDALDRFLYDLLEPNDEIFLREFNDTPKLLED